MSIAAISIRNFRSIISMNEKVCGLNIFVGQNDEGKSNVLRALDLFFNYGKDDGYDFDWNRDFCCFAPKRKQKAHEITIEIEIVMNSRKSLLMVVKKFRHLSQHTLRHFIPFFETAIQAKYVFFWSPRANRFLQPKSNHLLMAIFYYF